MVNNTIWNNNETLNKLNLRYPMENRIFVIQNLRIIREIRCAFYLVFNYHKKYFFCANIITIGQHALFTNVFTALFKKVNHVTCPPKSELG